MLKHFVARGLTMPERAQLSTVARTSCRVRHVNVSSRATRLDTPSVRNIHTPLHVLRRRCSIARTRSATTHQGYPSPRAHPPAREPESRTSHEARAARAARAAREPNPGRGPAGTRPWGPEPNWARKKDWANGRGGRAHGQAGGPKGKPGKDTETERVLDPIEGDDSAASDTAEPKLPRDQAHYAASILATAVARDE